jgi:hypothetical protein
MFSANENLALRQHKRRIVGYVEACIPEDVLDLGTNVMVMQVSCQAPGCVPLETAIVIVFPTAARELLPGLPESQGGSYKTKVIKPMSAVTKEDILESLPPEFPGGLRSVEKLCLQVRDVMLAQITQLFEKDDDEGKRLMAQYLQTSLQDYMDRDCTPPEWGQSFSTVDAKNVSVGQNDKPVPALSPISNAEADIATGMTVSLQGTKNVVIRRVLDVHEETQTLASTDDDRTNEKQQNLTYTTSVKKPSVDSVTRRRLQQSAERELNQMLATSAGSSNNALARLALREHAPGMRQPGCPCCDPDNPSNVVNELLRF